MLACTVPQGLGPKLDSHTLLLVELQMEERLLNIKVVQIAWCVAEIF